MRLALLVALCACGKPDRPADSSGSGSSGSGVRSTPSDATPLPLAARCSGRWSGTIKWTKPTCSDSVLALAGTFDLTIHAEKETWQVDIAKPARTDDTSSIGRRDPLQVTWDARPGHETCSASLTLDWTGAKPETTDVTFTFGDGSAGPTAHALVHHRSRHSEECDAEGSTTPIHEPDSGLVPETTYDRYAVGDYKLAITWTEPSMCDVGVKMPDALAYRIDIDATHSNRLIATGMTVPGGSLVTESVDARSGPIEIVAGIDVGPRRHVLMQRLTVDSLPPVSGEVLFSVLDGDMPLCARHGTLAGKRTHF